MATGVLERTAGAPISWGVCEVPGWGHQLPASHVLSELADVGLRATEAGPPGFLPDDPRTRQALLAEHDLRLVAGFHAIPVGERGDAAATIGRVAVGAAHLARAGATTFVTCPVWSIDRWRPPSLGRGHWAHLASVVTEIDDLCGAMGLTHAVHPHAGGLVETGPEVAALIDDTEVSLVLDTGHLALGGVDPVDIARDHPERVAHVHLKDMRRAVAQRMEGEGLGLREAVAAGLFTPLGEGDLPIAEVVHRLEAGGYRGWYVLEQDRVIPACTGASAPFDPSPADDVRRSIAHLRSVAESAP